MASTQLTDLNIVASVFAQNVILRALDVNAFVQSGVCSRDVDLDNFLNGPIGGKTYNPRFYAPLGDSNANVSSDNPASTSTPGKIEGVTNTAVRQSLNKSWSVMDLSADLNGDDPVGAITTQIGDYWNGELQRRVLASCKGALFGATPAADMTVDVTSEAGAAAYFNADAFIDAKTTMGDRAYSLTAVAVHSHVYATMQKLNLIDFIPDARGEVNIPTYQGLRVVVDDGMTVVSGTPNKYISYLFGAGAIALGVGAPKVPYEVERKPDSGNGGGEEVLYSRVEWIIHPQGFRYGSQNNPAISDLSTTTNWTRAFERKRIPLAALVTK